MLSSMVLTRPCCFRSLLVATILFSSESVHTVLAYTQSYEHTGGNIEVMEVKEAEAQWTLEYQSEKTALLAETSL